MMIDKLSPTLSCLPMIPTINSTHPHHNTSDSTQFGALQKTSGTTGLHLSVPLQIPKKNNQKIFRCKKIGLLVKVNN